MIKYLALLGAMSLPQQMLAETTSLDETGRNNFAQMQVILSCLHAQPMDTRSFGGQLFSHIEYRTPRNLSVYGALATDQEFLPWEVILEFFDGKITAFDGFKPTPPVNTANGQIEAGFRQIEAPMSMQKALLACGVDWFGPWTVEQHPPTLQIENLLPPTK